MSDRSIGELFNDALEHDRAKREAFLRQACGNDEELYTRISSLLALHDQLGGFMKEPIAERVRGGRDENAGPVTVTEKLPIDGFAAGQLLGDRYRIEALLGRGGMGEVWRAYDLKLHVDVALKRLHRDLFNTERGLQMLRHEVRSARNVMSPHVCRIFDLVAADGQELVSMEYIDGHTLQDLLKEKAPLELREAGEIAAQLLAGLEAIHEADLVHRDVKPSNVMITRSGRVVLMDFGLAKGLADLKEGSIAGTPAYMAPEQARGAALDARADIFAAGVILAEMIGPSDQPSREALWARVREDPAKVPEGPWEGVLRKAVAWDPNGRYATAKEMARALEEVTLRAEGVEERAPYPGLNPFTEKDAEFFFGREVEVETVWKKLQRSNLLAVIGLSGVGKSSFLRAGLLPATPPDWRCVVCTPGASPFKALGQTMVPEMSGDDEAMGQLFDLERPGVGLNIFHKWRRRHGEVLLILDQFEELFTLNRPKVQDRFTQLLQQLAMEADVHVLISMRDDFLFQCQEYPALHPVLTDLTLMGRLSGNALRRALVQPALACGYRYEDDTLVDEMIEEIREERGALPLLAFAAASMWEHRDRTTGTLTRRAYERIGGVGGALARHAEATMERIGPMRHEIVREIFRNLSTAQGTRAVRLTKDLLTLFDDKEEAQKVLRQLIEARLITSFDAPGSEGGDDVGQRVEIIHESLLTAWPRLVRWRTQDADGAQLHDQLRQAAQLWQERSQSDDLLWTGTAFREFEVWQERYEGALTETERAFAQAMERRDRRRRRIKRTALVSSFAVLLIVLAVVGSLWRNARDLARRTEALRYQEIGEEVLESDNSRSLAFAIASLERVDSPEARWLAMQSLWKGPTRFVPPEVGEVRAGNGASFSPDGKWLATGSEASGVLLWPSDGSPPRKLPGPDGMLAVIPFFSPSGRWLAARFLFRDETGNEAVVWSVDSWEPIRRWEGYGSRVIPLRFDAEESRILGMVDDSTTTSGRRYEWWDLHSERRVPLGCPPGKMGAQGELFMPSGDARWLASWEGNDVYVSSIDSTSLGTPQWIGRNDEPVGAVAMDAAGDLIAVRGQGMSKRSSIWRRSRPGAPVLRFDPQRPLGPWLGWGDVFDGLLNRRFYDDEYAICDRRGPLGMLPLQLQAPGGTKVSAPAQPWLAVVAQTHFQGLSFCPMQAIFPHAVPIVGRGIAEGHCELISSDGNIVITHASDAGVLRLQDLRTPMTDARQVFEEPERRLIWTWKFDPAQEQLIVGTFRSGAWVVPLGGGEPRLLEGSHSHTGAVAFSPSGRRMATGAGWAGLPKTVYVWNADGERISELIDETSSSGDFGDFIVDVEFLSETELLVASGGGLGLWDIESREVQVLESDRTQGRILVSPSFFIVSGEETTTIYDRATLAKRELPLPPFFVTSLAISPDESFIATGYFGGNVRVLYLEENVVHTLHNRALQESKEPVCGLWIDPRGRWLASLDNGERLRYWPVPHGRPLDDRPIDEFLEVLRAQTNFRVVTDPEASSGYREIKDAFGGWETTPTWQDWYSEDYYEDPPWQSIDDVLEETDATNR